MNNRESNTYSLIFLRKITVSLKHVYYTIMLEKPKKVSKAKLRIKADTLASQYYRAITPHCEAQGLDSINCGGGLQWCHIFSRSVIHMRYEPYNNLVMCAGHHTWYTHNPIEWTRFLEKNYLERLSLAEAQRYKYDKIEYEYWINFFKTQLSVV